METAMQKIIEKFTEAQRFIISNDQYAKGYDGALSDCITLLKSFLEQEKEQIIDAVNKGTFKKGTQYYEETYKK